ncbi:SRPBCC family protein [Gordonia otitidis]|uniref:SRPBCC family protein n=1 Tax=Gordonia otitidis TaxID=249058 RepID=UPI001D1597D6|nr:SRPBCC family protein [Gordonia otitidis]UEA58808.1 SRPBCC family protein [Gordonia otitidis]
MRYTLEDSIDIHRSAADVYAVISDVTRTGEWSQQCHTVEWVGPERGVGARFAGHNRTPTREWTTTSQVTVADPGSRFEWTVGTSGTTWGYRLEPIDDATTRLTEYTAFTGAGEDFFSERFGDDADNQIQIRLTAAATGIGPTLAQIKKIVEA